MRELTAKEIDQVNGGILPVVMFGVALGSKFTATSLAGWAFSSAGLIGATYQAAKYLGSN